ncbi:MAG: hypothetical protein RIB60_07805 [Phycisphaerales bacterium]
MGLAFLLPQLLFVALVVIMVVSALRGAWVSAFVSKKYSTPHCPGCQYEIDQTNPIAQCPECGRDLRVAGVLTPELVLRLKGKAGNIWGGIGLLTIVIGVIVGSVVLAAVQPGDGMTALWVFLGGFVAPIPLGIWAAWTMHRRRRRVLAGSLPSDA